MATGNPPTQHPRDGKPPWVRRERDFSNSMWHADYNTLGDKRHMIAYQDDASRFIVGFGVFDEATGAHAIQVLDRAIEAHGIPAAILTDREPQFYAKCKDQQTGASEFEMELVRRGIKHLLSRINTPMTNSKLHRFYGEIKAKIHFFQDVDEFVNWWNNDRPHSSLDWDTLETPARAFARKVPGATLRRRSAI